MLYWYNSHLFRSHTVRIDRTCSVVLFSLTLFLPDLPSPTCLLRGKDVSSVMPMDRGRKRGKMWRWKAHIVLRVRTRNNFYVLKDCLTAFLYIALLLPGILQYRAFPGLHHYRLLRNQFLLSSWSFQSRNHVIYLSCTLLWELCNFLKYCELCINISLNLCAVKCISPFCFF